MTTRNNLVLLSLIRNVLFSNYLKSDMAGWEVKVDQTGSDGMQALTHARENTDSPDVVKHPPVQGYCNACQSPRRNPNINILSGLLVSSSGRLKEAIKTIVII